MSDMPHADIIPAVRRSLVRILVAVEAVCILALACMAYARFIEPHWLRVRRVRLSDSPTIRVVHISDLHFDGDVKHLDRVVKAINDIDADFVCFTGDMVEDSAFLKGALDALSKVNKPLYGIAGNHDFWALRSFADVCRAFESTGGKWLTGESLVLPEKGVVLMSIAQVGKESPPGHKRILLEHNPDVIANLQNLSFDLILSGHTHGGQVRIPIVSRLILPFDPDTFDRGLFHTPCGPLYVNPGIGTYFIRMRLLCRPEITLIEI